ncbi:MAG TPA: serine hydrolase [Flavilitoribacter sp.]|nr:serine hydrolase [Flavilitoribacter sp.]HMQ90256.1 serine hydrolase [Flavilitoribacter sp.]
MKIHKLLVGCAKAFLLFGMLATISSCGVTRALTFLKPDARDYRLFPRRVIYHAGESFEFIRPEAPSHLGQDIKIAHSNTENNHPLDDFVHLFKTHALIIIRNDSILYESYQPENYKEDVVTSFSVSKAILSTLVGIAIHEGYIQGVHQHITDFLPEWKARGGGYDSIQVIDLMQHTSGVYFVRSPWKLSGDQVQFYYGRNISKRALDRELVTERGTRFNYNSANTQLLTLVLERATGQTLSGYLQEKIWEPLGMESDAFWSLDKKGKDAVERAFCCLQARAVDFAKIGRLWLHNGNWNGRQIFPETWLQELFTSGMPTNRSYRSGFTLGPHQYGSFMATGLFGQMIYVDPGKNLVIVRFGGRDKDYSVNFWKDVMLQLSDAL